MGSVVRCAPWALRGALVAALAVLPFMAQAESSRVQALSAKVDALAAQVAALQARGARVNVAPTPADLVGDWTLTGFQSELHGGAGAWQVRSYVHQGTISLYDTGKYKLTVASSGNELINGGNTVQSFASPEQVAKGKWTVKGNTLMLDGNPGGTISADMTVVTRTNANPADNTNVMLVLTKQPAP